jgi:NAD(P)-dependent dehydrogenase (short-subunit alcohol dehydrogenase family)
MTDTEDTPVALVTGGAIRVGAAIVRELATRNYQVAIHANTSLDRAQELATELNSAGHTAVAFGADLRDEDATPAPPPGRPRPSKMSWPTTSAASSKSTR